MSVSLDGVSFLQETEGPEFIQPGDKTNLGKDAFLKLLVAQDGKPRSSKSTVQ